MWNARSVREACEQFQGSHDLVSHGLGTQSQMALPWLPFGQWPALCEVRRLGLILAAAFEWQSFQS